MPDAYGNLLGQDEFANRVRVRFHSYLDSENLVLALGDGGAFLYNLANGPRPDITSFCCTQTDGGFHMCLTDTYGISVGGMLWWPLPSPAMLALETPLSGYRPEQFIFTIDMVQSPWFALNNHDHSFVADVDKSATSQGTSILAWGWNGGANQIWRAQVVS